MAILKKYVHNRGRVVVRPVIRSAEELFSTTVTAYAAAQSPTLIINANFYDLSRSGYVDVLIGNDPVPANATTPLGHVVNNGRHVAGTSAPQDFYIAFDQTVSFNGADLTAAFTTGRGNPPLKSAAFGGLGPLIIAGLPFGTENRYKAGASAGAPRVGQPSSEDEALLSQRSSAKYSAFATRDRTSGGTLGKTCLAVNPSNVMVYCQEDGSAGMSIDAIRDEFIAAGCKHAVFFDGSDSAMLYERSGGFLVRQGPDKDESCVVGLSLFWYAA